MSAVSGDGAGAGPSSTASSASKPRRHKKNRMSAIRVWSDSGDQGLELLVVEHATEEQQLGLKLHSLRTAVDHCREHIDSAHSASSASASTSSSTSTSTSSLTLSETSVRLRGILTELNAIDKQLTNSGISYASEETGGAITDADLPQPGTEPTKPSHRQVAALRSHCQDLLVRCEEEVKGGKERGQSEEKEEQKNTTAANSIRPVTVTDIDSPRSTTSTLLSSPSAAFTSDEDKAVIGETVAAALANEPARNSAAGAAAAAEAEKRAQMAKAGGKGSTSALGMDVISISRWGELLREPRKALTKEQQKKKQSMMERDEEREIKWFDRSPHSQTLLASP